MYRFSLCASFSFIIIAFISQLLRSEVMKYVSISIKSVFQTRNP
jgi:hypothetical protein